MSRVYKHRRVQGNNTYLMAYVAGEDFETPISPVWVNYLIVDVYEFDTLVGSHILDPAGHFLGDFVTDDPRWNLIYPDDLKGYNLLITAPDDWFPQSSILNQRFQVHVRFQTESVDTVLRYEITQEPIGDIDLPDVHVVTARDTACAGDHAIAHVA